MASFADAYWIEPNWLQTEQVVIHDPELAQVLEGIKVVQISDIFHERALRYGQDKDVCEPRDRDHAHPDTLFQPARNHPPRNKTIATHAPQEAGDKRIFSLTVDLFMD